MDNIFTILTIVQLFGWPVAGFVLLLYLFVLNPEKGEKFIGAIAGLFSTVSKRAERTKTGHTVQSKINSFTKLVNSEVNALLPYNAKVRWVSEDIDRSSFVRNGEVVILLRYHQNQDENLSRATLLYMNKAVIPRARSHIDFKLAEAIDLMMTKKALYSFIEARSSFDYFVSEILRPKTEDDYDIKEYCTVIDSLDGRGLFTRVLLRELRELGRRCAGTTETGDTVFETQKFAKFLNEITEKEQGKDVPLTFRGSYISTAIILIARPEIVGSTDPFVKKIREKIKEAVNVIYILARGNNIRFAKEVCTLYNSIPELVRIHSEEFPTRINGEIIPTYCAIFYNRKTV